MGLKHVLKFFPGSGPNQQNRADDADEYFSFYPVHYNRNSCPSKIHKYFFPFLLVMNSGNTRTLQYIWSLSSSSCICFLKHIWADVQKAADGVIFSTSWKKWGFITCTGLRITLTHISWSVSDILCNILHCFIKTILSELRAFSDEIES